MNKWVSLLIGVVLSASVAAQDMTFDEYVNSLKKEAREQGISTAVVEEAFANVKFKPRAVKADRNQPEKKLTLDEYIPRAVPAWKVKQARALYQQHYSELTRIGQEYGVQPRFIVALWGVESNFGKMTGGYHVIDALTTLAYEGRREAFFRKETMAALKILDQGHISVDKMLGSWAGAMGQCQFMPSSFVSYAVDGDADGKKDIWNNEADVFASAANYLKQFGWNSHYTWGRQVKVPKGLDATLFGRDKEKAKTLSQWSSLGVTKINGQPLPQLDTEIDAWLIRPDDENGRSYLIYNNYQVLMRWNRSYYFGLAVGHLADQIR